MWSKIQQTSNHSVKLDTKISHLLKYEVVLESKMFARNYFFLFLKWAAYRVQNIAIRWRVVLAYWEIGVVTTTRIKVPWKKLKAWNFLAIWKAHKFYISQYLDGCGGLYSKIGKVSELEWNGNLKFQKIFDIFKKVSGISRFFIKTMRK